MPLITPSVEPGYYLEPQTISFTFDPSVVGVSIGDDNSLSNLSKTIAYDNRTPANPYIAVSEEPGKGNIVYDCSFVKYLNYTINSYPTFPLTIGHRFFINAINYISNKDKVNSPVPNKNILFIGDAKSKSITGAQYSYSLADTYGVNPTGMKTTFLTLCSVAGYNFAFTTPSNYIDGVIDLRLIDLNNYCCVVIVSSEEFNTKIPINEKSLNTLVTYRDNGNGIMIISHFGPVLNNIAEAKNSFSQYTALANAVATKFGAYFSGEVLRNTIGSQTQIGYLRTTYGDHALYNGMSDLDVFDAYGRETAIKTNDVSFTSPNNVQPIQINNVGLNMINVTLKLSDNTIRTYRYGYSYLGPNFLSITAKDYGASSYTECNKYHNIGLLGNYPDIKVNLDGTVLGSCIVAEILLNNKRIGMAIYQYNNYSYAYIYSGIPAMNNFANVMVKNGDVITLYMRNPFLFSKSITVIGKNSSDKKLSLSKSTNDLKNTFGQSIKLTSLIKNLMSGLNSVLVGNNKNIKTNLAKCLRVSRDYSDIVPTLPQLQAPIIYTTQAQIDTSIYQNNSNSMQLYDTYIINATNGYIYAQKNLNYYKLDNTSLIDIFGVNRIIKNGLSSTTLYRVNSNNTLTQI